MSEELTAERVRELFDYDPLTGVLTWRHRVGSDRFERMVSSRQGGKPAGMLRRSGYVRVGISNKHYEIHRVVWLWVHGAWPSQQIDHINRIRADNRIENLRDVSAKVNNANRAPKESGVGVSWSKKDNRWRAYVYVGSKQVSLGRFATQDEARAAVQKRKEQDAQP